MQKTKLFLKLFFYLPGTLLHELAHYVPALIFRTRPTLSVLPSLRDDSAGRVTHIVPKYGIQKTVIALFPALWIAVLLWAWSTLGILSIDTAMQSISLTFRLPKYSVFGYLIFVYFSLQLLWAGTLSRRDLHNAIAGLFSLSGAVAVSLFYAISSYKM